ncbi:MAG: phosphopyruvate hydratase [Bacteroidales bacterium]|nr:phosphopyruvate hydratase [Bacteroidales bacterium]
MGAILQLKARQILDSRGIPTIEVDLFTDRGVFSRASVPSGSSSSKLEAYELRDNDPGRFLGKGVTKAIYNVNKVLNQELRGKLVTDQVGIDSLMTQLDGTDNKSNLGANAILAVSIAVAKAGAATTGQALYRYLGGVNAHVLPIPMMNMITGGINAVNKIDIQDIMILPLRAKTFSDAYRQCCEVFYNLQSLLKEKGYFLQLSAEGGLAPNINTNEEAIELVIEAIKQSGYSPEKEILLGLDFAGGYIYNDEKKKYILKNGNEYSCNEWINYVVDLVKKYPIVVIEDPLEEQDWENWQKITEILGDKILLVGDDLFVTNTNLLAKGIYNNIASGVSIKPNQVGTVTETLATIQFAMSYNYYPVISHRSGETEDVFISELCVATNAGILRAGAPCRLERINKYNQILRIEEILGSSALYHGEFFRYSREL